MTASTWAVRVEESRVFATTRGAEWWFWYRRRAEDACRIAIEAATIGGDQVLVVCDDQQHAEWLAAFMHEQGIPKAAAKAVRA